MNLDPVAASASEPMAKSIRWRSRLRRCSFRVGVIAAAVGSLGAAPAPQLAAPEIKTAPGFAVTRVYAVPREQNGSWVSLTADETGRLYASDQYGPLFRISLPKSPGDQPTVERLALPIGGAHGLTWIDGSLYAAVGQKVVCPTGLYRIRDTDRDGELDRVELLQALEGDGEHGPHAVALSPDRQSLYVIAGNATRLPPLVRSRVPHLWADDSLLAPLPALMGSETRGILPGGWICRTDLDGRSWELVCAGFGTPTRSRSPAAGNCSRSIPTPSSSSTCRGIAPRACCTP